MNTEKKVGLFFLISMVLIALLIMKTGQFELFNKGKFYTIQTVMDTAQGLDRDTDVRMAGVRIGKVLRVDLDQGKAVVTMEIQEQYQLAAGSRVKVVAKGILGDKYVEVLPAPYTGKLVQDGQRLESEQSTSMDDIMDVVYALATDLKAVTHSLKNSIGTQTGEKELTSILANIDRITADLRDITERNKQGFTASIDNIQSFTGDLREQIPVLTRKLDQLMGHLDEVVGENRENLKATLANAKTSTAKLDKTLDYIEDVARKIDEGQGTVGKLVNEDTAHEKLTATMDSFKNAMDNASDYLSTFKNTGVYLGFRSEYLTDISDSKSYFTVDIVPSEKRFYQVELIDSPYGKIKQDSFEHIITNPDGSIRDQYTEMITSNRDSLKFSATIGQRFGDFILKVGLIESKGGFGLGYTPPGLRRFNFFMEASDFSRADDLAPRLKLYGQYRFYRDLFVTAGVDDALESDYNQYFVGVGIRFRDDFFKNMLSNINVR